MGVRVVSELSSLEMGYLESPMNRFLLSAMIFILILITCSGASFGSTREVVKERGQLLCGVSTGIPGFSNADEKGVWSGLDVDICRAVALVVLGDAQKVKFVSLVARERFTALLSGEVDLLARNSNWTMARDTALGLQYTTTSFYDSQGYLVSKKSGISGEKDLQGHTLCTLAGTHADSMVREEFERRKWELKTLALDTSDQLVKAFDNDRCEAMTGPVALLLGVRQKLSRPETALLLPEFFGKISQGPVVRQDDAGWFLLVRWVLFAMINGEELQISSSNVDGFKNSSDPRVRRFLGSKGKLGKGLGLEEDWAYQIIKQIGNYGESFERNIGEGARLKMKRGLNKLWNRGGLLYAPELR